MRRGASSVLVLGVVFVGCDQLPESFRCGPSATCQVGDRQGTCEPNGYCSFADLGCTSGRRYVPHAPEGIGGACVGATLGEGLVLHLPFDEGEGTIARDASGHGNVGSLVNGPVWRAGGLRGALSFDGVDDYVSIEPSPTLNNLGPLTAAAWIEPDSMHNLARIIAKEDSGTGRWTFIIGDANSLKFMKEFGLAELQRTTTVGAIVLGSWQHVAVTWDGSPAAAGVHFFVNGVEATYARSQDGGGTRLPDAAMRLFVGNYFGADRPFAGQVDDVRVYSRALTAAEVQELTAVDGRPR